MSAASTRAGPIKVMIADDDADVRAALVDLIGEVSGFLVVGAAHDGDSALDVAVREHPDVAVIDVRMPGSGIVTTQRLRVACPGTVVIALSSYADRRTRTAMLEAGASRFLVKGATEADLIATISEVVTGRRPDLQH